MFKKMKSKILYSSLALIILCIFSPNVFAANYPLQIINIKPAGSGSPAIPSTNRIFRAYPGIEYNIRPAVVGGAYPYSFSLSGQPSGMTINSTTGEISWPNPQSNSGTITLTVKDSENTTVTTTWAITVSTSGFFFVNSNAGSNGTGTISSPFRTLDNLRTGAAGNPTAIAYFRGGNYNMTITGNASWTTRGMYWNDSPSTWLGYPGETVNISGWTGSAYAHVQMPYGVYWDRLNFSNFDWYALFLNENTNYPTIRRCKFTSLNNVSAANENQGFIFTAKGNQAYYLTIQDNEFSDYRGAQAIGSLYTRSYTLIENNYIHDGGYPSGHSYTTAIGTKEDMQYTFIRGNRIIVPGGNYAIEMFNWAYEYYYHKPTNYATDMEIAFNIISHTTTGRKHAMTFWYSPRLYVYRNTFVGDVVNLATNTTYPTCGTVDGFPGTPQTFYNNVILNTNSATGQSWYTLYDYFGFAQCTASSASDSCRKCINDTNNLKSTDTTGVIDGNYQLVNRSLVGTYGWEIGTSSSQTTPSITGGQICDDNGNNCRPINMQ